MIVAVKSSGALIWPLNAAADERGAFALSTILKPLHMLTNVGGNGHRLLPYEVNSSANVFALKRSGT